MLFINRLNNIKMLGIKLSEIETIDKQSFIKCKYVAKDGSVITKKYSYASLTEAKKDFKGYIDSNGLA